MGKTRCLAYPLWLLGGWFGAPARWRSCLLRPLACPVAVLPLCALPRQGWSARGSWRTQACTTSTWGAIATPSSGVLRAAASSSAGSGLPTPARRARTHAARRTRAVSAPPRASAVPSSEAAVARVVRHALVSLLWQGFVAHRRLRGSRERGPVVHDHLEKQVHAAGASAYAGAPALHADGSCVDRRSGSAATRRTPQRNSPRKEAVQRSYGEAIVAHGVPLHRQDKPSWTFALLIAQVHRRSALAASPVARRLAWAHRAFARRRRDSSASGSAGSLSACRQS